MNYDLGWTIGLTLVFISFALFVVAQIKRVVDKSELASKQRTNERAILQTRNVVIKTTNRRL